MLRRTVGDLRLDLQRHLDLNVSRAGLVVWCAVAISRSTKGPNPVHRSFIALPTRSWLVIAMGQSWWVDGSREASRSTPFIIA